MRGKRTKKRQRKPSQVSIRSGQVEFVKVGTDTWRWRDVYRWLLGLRWPQFAAFVASLYVGLNVFFAALYSLQQNSIAVWRSTPVQATRTSPAKLSAWT